MNSARLHLWLIAGLLLLYFTAAVWMAFRLPALAAPNELLNYEYIQVMRQIRGLPNRGLVDSRVRYTEWHQPPVYFTFAALVGLPVPVPPSPTNPPPPIEVEENPHYLSTPRGNLNPAVHISPRTLPLLYTSRVATGLLGMLGVAALYRAGRRTHGSWVGLLMASIMAFQPQYLHLSGAVNNDMPVTAAAAVVMAYAIVLLHRREQDSEKMPPLRAYFVLGFLVALAVLTKANGVFVLAFPAIVLLSHWLTYRQPTSTLTAAGAVALGLLPLWAGWLWLNTVRMRDTLGLSGSLPVGRVLALNPLDFGRVAPFLPAIWRSYWLDWSAGDVGYGPDWLYLFWLLALAGMLAGWLLGTKNGRGGIKTGYPSFVTLVAVFGFLGISYLYFAVKALTVKEAGWMVPEARWWLPGLPALAWLAAVGYARWWSPRRRPAACAAAAVAPPLLAFGLLAFHLPALYPRAGQVVAAEPGAATGLEYDGRLALTGVETKPMTVGREAEVGLVWRALENIPLDYTISTQLLVPAPGGWRKLAEHNSFPGLGMDPTRGWLAGATCRDPVVLVPSGKLMGPTAAVLHVWVMDRAKAVPVTAGGQPVDPPVAAAVVVRPALPPVVAHPLAAPVTFGDAIRLAGAALEESDDGLAVTLEWEATGPVGGDYAVFVHLVDEAGKLVAQADGRPNEGLSPTHIWDEGDLIRDVHRFPAGQRGAPGRRVLVGLYDPATGERVPARVAGKSLPENAFSVAPTN